MFRRLVDLFWSWENRWHDPDAVLRCPECGNEFRRRDAIGGRSTDSRECAARLQENQSW
jgi:hypothetical protein